jgi:hypothetical protein
MSDSKYISVGTPRSTFIDGTIDRQKGVHLFVERLLRLDGDTEASAPVAAQL